jgi:hypothetical protein
MIQAMELKVIEILPSSSKLISGGHKDRQTDW